MLFYIIFMFFLFFFWLNFLFHFSSFLLYWNIWPETAPTMEELLSGSGSLIFPQEEAVVFFSFFFFLFFSFSFSLSLRPPSLPPSSLPLFSLSFLQVKSISDQQRHSPRNRGKNEPNKTKPEPTELELMKPKKDEINFFFKIGRLGARNSKTDTKNGILIWFLCFCLVGLAVG